MNRLLIFAPNWLGDAVMALPAIADVRRASPGTTIAVMGPPAVAQLFGLVGDVDEVIEKGVGRGFRDGAAKTPPDPFFDAALLLPNSFRSALAAMRAGIPERWGYRADCRGPLLTRAIDRSPSGTHQIDSYRRLVQALGFPNGAGEPRITVADGIRRTAVDLLNGAGWDGRAPLVAFAPGAAYGSSKRWPPRYFAELARSLAGDLVRTVLVGSGADAAVGREIEVASGDPSIFLNLIGKTGLPALAGVLSSVRAVVANDSGAAHLAAALATPVTTVFGPTDERTNAPRSIAASAALFHPVWCRPCWLRTCPLDHRCMRGVTAASVAHAARRML